MNHDVETRTGRVHAVAGEANTRSACSIRVFAYDSQARLPPVKAPTLVVDGTGDFEPEIVRRGEAVASLIPNCRTRMMKGEDGNIIWWRPKALADVMEEFFERR